MQKKDRKQEFIKLVASGECAYQACIKAGYSKKYAKTNSHIMLEKYEKDIEALKSKAQERTIKKTAFNIETAIKECEIAQRVSLEMGRPNTQAYLKATELKARLLGLFQADNEQKTNNFEININRKPVNAKENN